MKLEPLTLDQCQQVRIWRNAEMKVWRTSFMLTEKMQLDFFENIVSNRESNHRYWALISREFFIGMGGITNIQWENRIGEITLIIEPHKRGDGYGEQAVDLLLDQAFNHLNLQTVFGECYQCNEAGIKFWKDIAGKYKGYTTSLPKRKYWICQYFSSFYFSIDKNDFNNRNKSGQ